MRVRLMPAQEKPRVIANGYQDSNLRLLRRRGFVGFPHPSHRCASHPRDTRLDYRVLGVAGAGGDSGVVPDGPRQFAARPFLPLTDPSLPTHPSCHADNRSSLVLFLQIWTVTGPA